MVSIYSSCPPHTRTPMQPVRLGMPRRQQRLPPRRLAPHLLLQRHAGLFVYMCCKYIVRRQRDTTIIATAGRKITFTPCQIVR